MDKQTTENSPTITVSLSRKVNLGNYESADVFISLSGLAAGTTEEEIDELLATTGALAYRKCAAALKEQVAILAKKGVA